MEISTLDKLRVNEQGIVYSIDLNKAMQRRMLELGFVKDTPVECVGKAPSGDPSAYLVRGAVIAVRTEDACGVKIYIDGSGDRSNRKEKDNRIGTKTSGKESRKSRQKFGHKARGNSYVTY